MEELLEILNDINPDVDYSKEKNLIDGKVYDSFSIITLVSNISEEFDIEISVEDLTPENFNSLEAMVALIVKAQG